jgi:hypothetical protein
MFSSSKHIFFLLQLVCLGLFVTGRESAKLYSIGNNSFWNQSSAWSLTENGPVSGLIPQANDSIVINTTVILNIDFTFSGSGSILIKNAGLIRGNAFKLTFTGNSSMQCLGEVQLYNLDVLDNSSIFIAAGSKLSVMHSMLNNSLVPIQVGGKLSVSGELNCGSYVSENASITGNGSVNSTVFAGLGEIMSTKPCNLIPAGSIVSEINWTGNVSSDWNDPLNWTGNEIPASLSNVAIQNSLHTPVLSGSGYCHNLFMSPGTHLAILPTSSLTIGSELFIEADAELLLKNALVEHASLICYGNVTGKVKSEIQVAGNTSAFVATPVTDALSGVFVNMYLRGFDEANAGWGSYIVPTDVELNPMQGYELFSAYSATRYFEGTPNFGDYSQVVSSLNDGWNLIGNPYPCYIDWQSGTRNPAGWQRGSIASAIYYTDASGSGNYSVYIPGSDDASINKGSRFIPPMQGFFVKAKQSGAISVNKQAIAPEVEISDFILHNTALKFKVESNGYSDETVVRFNSSSSFSFDDEFDAYKMTGIEDAPSLFTSLEDGTQMAINTMPSLSSALEIPISLTCNSEREFKLTVSGTSNFEFRYPLTLLDKATNTFIDLRVDSTYIFSHSPLSDPNRFTLQFEVVSGINDLTDNQTGITMIDGNIKINGQENRKCTVDVYGMDGKLVLHTSGTLSPDMMVPFQNNHGIYLVKVTTNTTSYARKLYAE